MTTHQHIIDRGPYKGMVETLTNNPHPAKTARCYMCAEPLNASSSWVSLVGDHQDESSAPAICVACAPGSVSTASLTKRSAVGTTPRPHNQKTSSPKSSLT